MTIHQPVPNSILQAKRQAIRQLIRQRRQALSQASQTDAALQLSQQLLHSQQIQQAKHIALYLSFDGEINTRPFIEQLWQKGHQVYLPVLHPFCRGYLLFLHYQINSNNMVQNTFGIVEPKLDIRHVIPLAQLDIVFTPLVAFDAQGQRLGMGGGFYDRTLQDWQLAYQQGKGPKPIGLAHDCQQVDHLPSEVWDIPLPEIFTPSHHFYFD